MWRYLLRSLYGRVERLEKRMDDETTRLKALETKVQAKIDADAIYQKNVTQAFADLKAKIPDTAAVDAELTNLETEIGNFQTLTLPS